MWRVLKLLAVAVVGVAAATNSTADSTELKLSAGVARRLGESPGNIAACYTPFHNNVYPLNGGGTNVEQLRQAIDDDFRIMSQYFTHVRTYYSMHFDIQVAPIAAKYGVKLYLGVFLTTESWGATETNAAVDAIKKYSDTVEAVLVGNENIMVDWVNSWDILNKINELKARAGADAWRVKYGTVQRANEYIDPKFEWKMRPLADQLDILGINIYPCFDNGYDGNNPTAMLESQWNAAARRFPASKLRLTETGYSTGGGPHWLSPRVVPNLDAAQRYYEGVVNWTPPGAESTPKFWFQAFDRRWGDPSAQGIEMELYFGFFTTSKAQKRGGFPYAKGEQAPGEVNVGLQEDFAIDGCTLEQDMDFFGNDIGNVARVGTNANVCFDHCNKRGGCEAFSWSAANGGTCWLKSARGSVGFAKGVKSGVKCTPTAAPNCPIEANVDYVGNDLANARSSSADGCFALCRKQSGCAAFSYANGVCYLKRAKGATKSINGVQSSVLKCDATPAPVPAPGPAPAPAPVACGVLESGVDYVANDIGTASASNAQGCFDRCAQRSGCGAFSWANGVCYLKSGKGATKSNSAVSSGIKCEGTPAPAPNPVPTPVPAPGPAPGPATCGVLEAKVDYVANDIGTASSSNAQGCFDKCAQRSNCGAFSWANGVCYLKSGKGATKSNDNVTSGVRCTSSSGGVTEPGVDYIGNDIGNAAGKNAQECMNICAGRNGCKAFTWTDYNRGTCWLKSGKGASRSVGGTIVSGYIN